MFFSRLIDRCRPWRLCLLPGPLKGPMPELHPEMQVIIKAREGIPVTASIDDERLNWTTYSARLTEPPGGDMQIDDLGIAAEGRTVAVRRYRPAALADDPCAPAVTYLHGGGLMKAYLDSSDAIVWGYAERGQAVAFSVDYRLTPEHPYPAALNGAYAVTEHLCENASALGLDGTRIAIAGDSAGGNLAAAVCRVC